MMSSWRRRVIWLSALTIATTGCGGTGGGGAPQSAPPGCGLEELAKQTEPVEITVWHFFTEVGGGAASPVFADLVERFNREQGQVRVKVKAIGSRPELVRRYMAIPPGGRGAPDLVQLPSPPTRAAADTGRIVPVQPCVDATGTNLGDFVPSALAATRAEGVQWGLPDGLAGNVLLYDAGAFARVGLDPDRPPATLAELRAAADRFRAAGMAKPVARLDVFSLLEASGVQLADADNGHGGASQQATFGTPEAHEVLGWARRLVTDELVRPLDPNGTWADDLLAIGRGESAMTVHSSLDLKDVSRALAQGQAPGFRLGVAALPTLRGPARTTFGAGSFLLSNGPSLTRRAAAWTFLEWFEAPAQQAQWHRAGIYLPTRRSAVNDAAVSDLWAREPVRRDGWAVMTGDTWVTQPFVGPAARLGRELGDAVEQVVVHGAPPDSALAQATANGNRYLAEYTADPAPYVRWLIGG